ncbi:hypothetical protein MKW92_014811 [Papaver armeniacum]|nr:hypothetical protein MKW92_014811 [Papaver armeniacum]
MKLDHKGFTPVTPKTVNSSPFTPLKHLPLPSEKKKTVSSLADCLQSPCSKVPDGDSPCLKVKNVQIIEKDNNNSVKMKQHNHVDVAIEAIESFRSLCSQQTQDSLDNVLIDLYKRTGRIDEHIELLQHKLQLVEDGVTYGGERTQIARAQGKKYYCSIEHEKSRLLGNLGSAYMQQENYQPDKNKKCNLAICLMHDGRIIEAKSFDRATEMLSELDSGPFLKPLEQKKGDCFKMETRVKVNSSSPVSSRYVVGERGLEHSDSRVSSTTKVQQTGTRRCLESSHHSVSPDSGQHSNHGFGGKWRADDSHLSLSPIYGADSGFGNIFGSSMSWEDMVEEQEPSEQHYLYSNTYSDWRKNSTPLRKDRRLQVFKEITSQEDSSVKDMDVVMKQLNRAIEAIKSFRSLCSRQSQESLDNVLIDLYKRAGRIGEHIELLQRRLQLLEDSGNKSHCCSAEHEKTRLLGNLGWAYMQQKNYKVADEFYGRALSVQPDENNECSLAICFMQKERIRKAKSLIQNHVVGGRGLVHSVLRVSASTSNVQQTGKRRCLDNSHPSKGQHQNHGFGRKWRVEDPHLSGSSKSGKSWADMVEKEEEDECLSLFSSENMVESVSEWSSSEDSSYMSQETDISPTRLLVDNLNDAEDTLQRKFEAADINGEFRKSAARRSLYFDQKQEQEPSAQQYLYSNTHECAGCSDSDSDSSGVHFPFDMDRFGETLEYALDDVKKGIESAYVSQPPVHEKHKGGTVIIVFLDGSKLYVVSDSRLSYEFIHPDTGVKEYRICYHTKGKCEGLRVKVEQVGEKITACEGFITALAGNYKIAHHVCENLKQMWSNEEIISDHGFLAEMLGDHSTDTDFVIATPTNTGGFQISSVTDKGVQPMVGRLLCLGSGAGLAEKIILEKLKKRNQKMSIVEMLKEVVYEVCGQEKTVGGVVTVAVSEVVGESDKDKKLKTEFFRFPSFKVVWPITILQDGIYFLPEDSFLKIDKNVLDFEILENIEKGELGEYPLRPDLVKVRVYLDVTDPLFYHASDFSERDFRDFEYLTLSYNQAEQKFKIVLESTDEEVLKMVVGKDRMFWDNENCVFVIC